MIEILQELFESLRDVLNEQISNKEKKLFENGEFDVLGTILTLSKNKNDFRLLIESSAISKDAITYKYSRESVELAKKKKFIRLGSGVNSNKYFISTNGVYEYYLQHNMELSSAFIVYDDLKYPAVDLKLKAQEKIWCIFLLLNDATEKESKLDTTTFNAKLMNKYFDFFKIIESTLISNGINIGKSINWGQGKDSNFRKFITNNVDLTSTGIYSNRPTSTYWLDLSTRKNVVLLLDLILDVYSEGDRININILFYKALRELSDRILTDLNEIPKDLNRFLIEELRD